MARSGKVSFTLLAVLILLCAAGLFAFRSGALKQWMDRSRPQPVAPPPPPVVEPEPKTPMIQNAERSRPNSIFDVPGAPTSNLPSPSVPRPAGAIPGPTGAIPTPADLTPPPNQPPRPTVRESRLKLDAAMAAVEKSLASDPAYVQAKSDADAADGRRKAAVNAYGAGSPEVLDAGRQWLDAKSKLQKIVASAAARNPAAMAAQRELSQAEADNRPTKR